MNEALIHALENRIELGEDKESLRAEVLAAGHGEAVFDAAYREAQLRVADRASEAELWSESEKVTDEAPVTVNDSKSAPPEKSPTLHVPALTVSSKNDELVSVSELLTRAANLLTGKLSVLGSSVLFMGAGIGFLYLLLFGVLKAGFAFADQLTGAIIFIVGFVLVYLLSASIGLVAHSVVIRSLLNRNLKPSFWSHLGWGVGHAVALLVIAFMLVALIGSGAILLAVPGLVILIYLSQSFHACASEGKTGTSALIRSVELVHGRFLKVLVRSLVIFGPIFLLTAFAQALQMGPLVFLGSLLLVSYWYIYTSTALFESLQSLSPGEVFSEDDKSRIAFWLRIVIVASVIFLLFTFGSAFKWSLSDFQNISESEVHEIQNHDEPDVKTEEEMRDSAQTSAIKQNLTTVRSQAELYWEENLSYAGVCSDPLAAYDLISRTYDLEVGNVHCADDRSWYLVEAELPDGTYFCVDSKATSEVVAGSRKGEETCL